MKDTTILLFTNSYPYSGAAEQTFIENELIQLQEHYHKIVLIPISKSGEMRPYLPSLEMDESFSDFLASEEKLGLKRFISQVKTILSLSFLREWANRPDLIFHISSLALTVWWLLRARSTEKWLKHKYSPSGSATAGETILYTYWCSPVTLGAGLFSKGIKKFHAVSRVLGSDLYENQHENDYIPFRYHTLDLLEKLFVVSDLGKKYLEDRYPNFAAKYITSRIGVSDPGFIANNSTDGTIRVVSCSYLVPVKRIDLLIDGLMWLAREHPDRVIHWTHIGDGPLRKELEGKINDLPVNLTCHLTGYLPSVFDYYRETAVDVFINTSSSEGIPVSVMEAESCGIPVIATAVGGNPEIVTEECGILIPADPSPTDIGEAILGMVSKKEHYLSRKSGARNKWEMMFNSEKNFSRFIVDLDAMIEPGI